jgi:ferritin
MRLDKKLEQAMNEQVTKEFQAAYLYLAMAAWCEERNFDGFARWMRVQAKEETSHALKIFDFVLDRGGSVALGAIAEPKATWKTPLAVFEAAAKHEAAVSASILSIYETAGKAKDYSSQIMLEWFITEQVEEEKTSTTIVEHLRRAGDSSAALMMLDRQLGERGGE